MRRFRAGNNVLACIVSEIRLCSSFYTPGTHRYLNSMGMCSRRRLWLKLSVSGKTYFYYVIVCIMRHSEKKIKARTVPLSSKVFCYSIPLMEQIPSCAVRDVFYCVYLHVSWCGFMFCKCSGVYPQTSEDRWGEETVNVTVKAFVCLYILALWLSSDLCSCALHLSPSTSWVNAKTPPDP